MAEAMMPGAASGRVTVRKARSRDDIARRQLELGVDGGEGSGGDPHGEDEAVRRMDEDDACYRAVEADRIEDARDVEIDGDAGKGLRQQEGEQDGAAPRQPPACKCQAGGHGEGEADDDAEEGDRDAGGEGGEDVARRPEHLVPEFQPVDERQLVREIPLLGEGPEREIGERPEDEEGEDAERDAARQPGKAGSHGVLRQERDGEPILRLRSG
jgi:hypothetical protein